MEDLLRFEFSSRHNSNRNMNYYVYARTHEDLLMFLRQHNFINVPNEAISIKSVDETSVVYGLRLLRPFNFRSNKNNQLFTVMTCDEFVNATIESVANELCQFSLFGEAIMRRDIGIFDMIASLVGDLTHVHIIDYTLADEYKIFRNTDFPNEGCSADEMTSLTKSYLKHIGAPTEDGDLLTIIQSLQDSIDHTDCDVYPITLESYVANFTEMMVDAFN